MATFEIIKRPWIWSAGVVWPVACTAVVAARFSTRRARQNRLGWDDWLVIPAWLLTCGLSAIVLVGAKEKVLGYPAFSKDSLAEQDRKLSMMIKLFYLAFLVFIPAMTCVKLSCIAFYWRVFRTGQSKTTDAALYFMVAVTVAWGVGFTFANIFACGRHLDYAWLTPYKDWSCPVNQVMWQRAMVISDIIIDALLLIFPIPEIWKLNTTKARKVGLSIIFLFGSFSIATSTTRAATCLEAIKMDMSYFGTQGIYFFLLEVGFGLIAICIPTLSGAIHLQAVQNFFARISSLLCHRKQSSNGTYNLRPGSRNSEERIDKDMALPSPRGDHPDIFIRLTPLRSGNIDTDEPDDVCVSRTVELTKSVP